MNHLDDLIFGLSVEDFWRAINDLDATIDGKDYRKLIAKYFHPNGQAKITIQNIHTDQQAQEINEVNNFILSNIVPCMHINRLRDRKAQRKAEIQMRKEANRVRHQLARGGRSVEES